MERMMKLQDVILKAMARSLTEAAEIACMSVRNMQRMRQRYQEGGYNGLFDQRRGKRSIHRIPMETAERVLAGDLSEEEQKVVWATHYAPAARRPGIREVFQVAAASQSSGSPPLLDHPRCSPVNGASGHAAFASRAGWHAAAIVPEPVFTAANDGRRVLLRDCGAVPTFVGSVRIFASTVLRTSPGDTTRQARLNILGR